MDFLIDTNVSNEGDQGWVMVLFGHGRAVVKSLTFPGSLRNFYKAATGIEWMFSAKGKESVARQTNPPGPMGKFSFFKTEK